MKILYLILLFSACYYKSTAQSAWVKTDTLMFWDETLETYHYAYFLPNGKFLFYGNEGGWLTNEYGDWTIKEDSVHINISFVHAGMNTTMPVKIDTSFYRCYKLNGKGLPQMGEQKSTEDVYFPETHVLFDKLKKEGIE